MDRKLMLLVAAFLYAVAGVSILIVFGMALYYCCECLGSKQQSKLKKQADLNAKAVPCGTVANRWTYVKMGPKVTPTDQTHTGDAEKNGQENGGNALDTGKSMEWEDTMKTMELFRIVPGPRPNEKLPRESSLKSVTVSNYVQ